MCFRVFILYMSAIKPIQANMMFKVDPVSFYSPRNNQQDSQNFVKQDLFKNSENGYNLFHPKIAGSETKAKILDLTA